MVPRAAITSRCICLVSAERGDLMEGTKVLGAWNRELILWSVSERAF